MNRTATTSPKKPHCERVVSPGKQTFGKGTASGYVPVVIRLLRPRAVIPGWLANAKMRVAASRESSKGRPGYLPKVPPHEGRWQASRGAGIIPWKRPKPARTTMLRLVPTLYAMPRRGSKFFHCVLRTFEGHVSHSQRIPPFKVRRLVARHLS